MRNLPSHHDWAVNIPVTVVYKYPGWIETVQKAEHLSGKDFSVGPAGFVKVVIVTVTNRLQNIFSAA